MLHVDRFGNLITNFDVDEFSDITIRPFEMSVGTRKIDRLAHHYAEMNPEISNSRQRRLFRVAANQASAAKLLGCGLGAPCDLTLY